MGDPTGSAAYSAGYQPRNTLRKHSKISDAKLVGLVDLFCHGVGVNASARATVLAQKTVREIFKDLRARVTTPEFAIWHRANVLLPNVSSTEQQALIKTAYFNCLSSCYANERCFDNFRSGGRKRRMCRACPIASKFTSNQACADAIDAVDAVRTFYRNLNIRRERDVDPVVLFRIRFIHTVVIVTVWKNTRKLPGGLLDITDSRQLSFASLRRKFIENLID